MSLRPGVEHSIRLWKELPQNSEKLKLCFDQYKEVFYRICDRKNVKHLVSVEKKFVAMFDDAKENDVKSIGTKDLRQMIELKHAKCKARPLRKDFDEKNPDVKVRSVTEKAFREVKSGKWEAAIATLSDLYCVGPATGEVSFTQYSCNRLNTFSIYNFLSFCSYSHSHSLFRRSNCLLCC